MTLHSDKPAYLLYNKNGKQVEYHKILQKLQQADVILFGEYHNNPISHWLQLQVTKDLFTEKKGKLILGGEMFESDNQLIINEYLNQWIKERNFENECRLWDNYQTDYKPLMEFAKTNQLPFIATNIPRRYASVVASKGLEKLQTLPQEAQKLIAPLPIPFDGNLPAYQKMIKMMTHGHGGQTGGMNAENFAKAQAIKDATMAHFIVKNHQKDSTFLHFNGAYHSDNFEGIGWYLKNYAPKLKIVTISTVEQENIQKLEAEAINQADFIICVPADMTKTY